MTLHTSARIAESATGTSAASAEQAVEAGLVYVSDGVAGITRKRRRKRKDEGFDYVAPDGSAITNETMLHRVRALAVPPAYTDVWICRNPRGQLQATGRDARGRKQYRYHAQWSSVRGNGKFERIVAFCSKLPRLRRMLRRDLKLRGYPREKVLAIVVSVMAETLVRVGNTEYARDNKSFGLTTLRNRHAAFARGGRARLVFKGKGGLPHDVEIDDKRLVKLIRGVQQLPGQSLFQYRDDDDNVRPIDSGEVNDYLRAVLAESFTAKDFRTWGATLATFQRLARLEKPEDASERALAQLQNEVISEVAQALGNTVAVCRKAYIDPLVFAGWRDGSLTRAAEGARGERQWEHVCLKFLARAHKAQARAAAKKKPGKKTQRGRKTNAGSSAPAGAA